MKTYTNFKKFDRKYLFLEYNLTNFLPWTKAFNQKLFNVNSCKQTDRNFKRLHYTKVNIVSSYLKLIESTIQTDFILINNFWTFFKFYAKPKLFRFFPDRRSFFCYWIFPFVGFVAISYFNRGITRDFCLIDGTHRPISQQNSNNIVSKLNWEKIEYLNYKKLFLNNYFKKVNPRNLAQKPTNVIHQKNTDSGIKKSTSVFLKSFSNISEYKQQRLTKQLIQTVKEDSGFDNFNYRRKNHITIFEQNETNSLVNICDFYLNQTAELIYNTQAYGSFANSSSNYTLEKRNFNEHQVKLAANDLNQVTADDSKANNDFKKQHFDFKNNVNEFKSEFDNTFLKSTLFSKTETYVLKSKFMTETILGNYFTSNSFLNSYWYTLSFQQMNTDYQFKKTKLLSLKTNFFEKANLTLHEGIVKKYWQIDQDFPEKFLPFNCLENLSKHFNTSNKIHSPQNPEINSHFELISRTDSNVDLSSDLKNQTVPTSIVDTLYLPSYAKDVSAPQYLPDIKQNDTYDSKSEDGSAYASKVIVFDVKGTKLINVNTKLNVFSNIVDLEFKEKDILPIFITELKTGQQLSNTIPITDYNNEHKGRNYFTSGSTHVLMPMQSIDIKTKTLQLKQKVPIKLQPIISYKKANILLNTILDKFQVDFGIRLEPHKLQNLFFKQINVNSNLLHYLKKLLITSKCNNPKNFTSLIQLRNNLALKKGFSNSHKNQNLQLLTRGYNFEFLSTAKIPYYIRTKKYLNSILLKKILINIKLTNILNKFTKPTSKSLYNIAHSYTLQRKLLTIKQTEKEPKLLLRNQKQLRPYNLSLSTYDNQFHSAECHDIEEDDSAYVSKDVSAHTYDSKFEDGSAYANKDVSAHTYDSKFEVIFFDAKESPHNIKHLLKNQIKKKFVISTLNSKLNNSLVQMMSVSNYTYDSKYMEKTENKKLMQLNSIQLSKGNTNFHRQTYSLLNLLSGPYNYSSLSLINLANLYEKTNSSTFLTNQNINQYLYYSNNIILRKTDPVYFSIRSPHWTPPVQKAFSWLSYKKNDLPLINANTGVIIPMQSIDINTSCSASKKNYLNVYDIEQSLTNISEFSNLWSLARNINDKFIKTKMTLFSNNLHINQRLVTNLKVEPMIECSKINFLTTANEKRLKNYTFWSKRKIADFNSKTIVHPSINVNASPANNINYGHPSGENSVLFLTRSDYGFSVNRNAQHFHDEFTALDSPSKRKKIVYPRIPLWRTMNGNKSYYSHKLNNHSFNKLNYGIYSKLIRDNSKKQSILKSKFETLNTTHSDNIDFSKSVNSIKLHSNSVLTKFDNESPRNLINKINSSNFKVDNFENKINTLKNNEITINFSNYIKNLSNKLKFSLRNSKLYVIKIYNRKGHRLLKSKENYLSIKKNYFNVIDIEQSLNKVFRKNFYINLNNNKNIALKIKKIKYYINDKKSKTIKDIDQNDIDLKWAEHANFNVNAVNWHYDDSVDKSKYVLFRNNVNQLNYKPPIEKIFRNYLSSKYNKNSNRKLANKDTSIGLKRKATLSFLRKDSILYKFKRKNKKITLKISKKNGTFVITQIDTDTSSPAFNKVETSPSMSEAQGLNLTVKAKDANTYRLDKSLLNVYEIQDDTFNRNDKSAPQYLEDIEQNDTYHSKSKDVVLTLTDFSDKKYNPLKSKIVARNSLTLLKYSKFRAKNLAYSSKANYSIKTPYNIIKKLGFIFFRNDFKLSTNSIINETNNSKYTKLNLNSGTRMNIESYKNTYLLKNTKKQNLLKRLEKGKNLQKKRRQKKQARLTGRRKKRKRFFPRPIWLRFLLYKKVIQFRHFSKLETTKETFHSNLKVRQNTFQTKNSNPNNMSPVLNSLNSNFTFEEKKSLFTDCRKCSPLRPLKLRSESLYSSSIQLNNKNIRRNIYRTNKQNWGNIFFDIPNLEKVTIRKLLLIESLPIVAEIKFYDISSNLLQDFKQTMWKSYWLRTNFTNYIQKNSDYLNQIKVSVTESNVLINLKNFIFEILGVNFKENSLKLFALNLDFKNIGSYEQFYNDSKITNNDAVFNSFNQQKAESAAIDVKTNFLHFPEFKMQSYDQFMTTLLVNKSNVKELNSLKLPKNNKMINSKFSINPHKNYTPLWYLNVRRNFSNFTSIPTGYTYIASSNLAQFNRNLYDRIQFIIKNIKFNLNVDGHSQLRAFNPGRSQSTNLISDNFLTNLIKDWWIRFENSLNYSFSVLNIPEEIYLNQTKFRILWALNKTNVWSFTKNTDNSFTWNQSKIRDQNKSNKTNKAISIFFSNIKHFNKNKSSRRQKLIHTMFIEKFQTTNDKIKQLGVLIPDKQHLHQNLRPELQKNLSKQNETVFSNIHITNLIKKVSNLTRRENVNYYFKTHPKNYLQFWWSETNLTNYNLFETDLSFTSHFWMTPELQKRVPYLSDKSYLSDQQFDTTLFVNNSNYKSSEQKALLVSYEEDSIMKMQSIFNKTNVLSNKENYLNVIDIEQNLTNDFITVWGCLILFHVCILFSLFNISQIRTFLKFQVLCVYKVTNIYLTIIYSTFKNLKQLKTNLFLYSGISSTLVQNLTLTKKSFLLMVQHSPKIAGYSLAKLSDFDLSLNGKEKYLPEKGSVNPYLESEARKFLKTTKMKRTYTEFLKFNSPQTNNLIIQNLRPSPELQRKLHNVNALHLHQNLRPELQKNLSNLVKGQYIVLTDFKKSILNFFTFYHNPLQSLQISKFEGDKTYKSLRLDVNNKAIKKTRNFNLLQVRDNLKFEFSLNLLSLTNLNSNLNSYKENYVTSGSINMLLHNETNQFVTLPKLVSSKFDRYEAINIFVLKNKYPFFNVKEKYLTMDFSINGNDVSAQTYDSKFHAYKSKVSTNVLDYSVIKKNAYNNKNVPNFVFNMLLNSTNLVCYNFLKIALSLVQRVSLMPSRSIHNYLSNDADDSKQKLLENHVQYNPKLTKILPNRYETIATLVLNKYIKRSVYLSILFLVSILIKVSNKSLIAIYSILFKLIDLLEGVMLVIYKTLEKPAELMIDFISEFFLIEWSADVLSFIPDTFDIYTSSFSQKLMRNFRVVGFPSFFWQRRFLCFLDMFIDRITKPDADLIIRQKKGIIFWDIWAEILVQAAEIYSINLSSLFNIKEEQDLFLEKLLNDNKWDWSTAMLSKMSPLMELIKNSSPDGLTHNWSLFLKSEQIWRRWSVNPYYTYQGNDTDLFVENHPPKSFSHFKLMKYYPPVFEPIGNLVCQIYSGTLVKTVSKNLLLVGSRGTNKTLLIQAIAGETELKIMIDNANRYALTSRGVAIGMKLLKDVFDALALQAPCLFIIEDIHVIGERRPMLISDDENIKATENSFGVDQEEIHEKNQVIYQLSRHSIVHYKKPYKGDFSLLIPTNHFALDFFLGFSPPKTRVISQVPQNPLPIKSIEQEISHQNDADKTAQSSYTRKLKILSQIQLPKKEVFSPPSTSPFTILLLKEQKKIKPKKIVSEMPWGGLSSDQLIQLPKASYSVRVKVALLADIAIRNLSVKLDRITDLLIIIDSVRSHRGFVVVATTHIPSILDPALRRPGRFDETLTIPALSNMWSRWEILKASISDFVSTLDLIDLAELFKNLNDTELSTIISKTKLFLLTKQNFLREDLKLAKILENSQKRESSEITEAISYLNDKRSVPQLQKKLPQTYYHSAQYLEDIEEHLRPYFVDTYESILFKPKQIPKVNVINSFGDVLKLSTYPIIVEPYQIKLQRYRTILTQKDESFNDNDGSAYKSKVISLALESKHLDYNESCYDRKPYTQSNSKVSSLKYMLNSFNPAVSMFKTSTNCLSVTYFQISKWFISSQLIKDQKSYAPLLWSTISGTSLTNSDSMLANDIFTSSLSYTENTSAFAIYNSQSNLKNELLQLFAGKIGEFFVFYDIKSLMFNTSIKSNNNLDANFSKPLKSAFTTQDKAIKDGNTYQLDKEFTTYHNKDNNKFQKNYESFWNDFQSLNTWQYSSLINTYGIDETWRRASDLIFSIIYKRCLYNKNILIYRLFNLETIKSLRQPPSPPVSSSFIAAKRYENYKRIEFDFQNRITFSVHEKIQKHQQQRYIKTLYNKPIKKYFRSELQAYNKKAKFLNSLSLTFENSFREITGIDTTHKFQSQNKSSRLSSSYFFFNNRINIRHRFYLINQWWNTQLPEHNAETTFLSEIDWRYMFKEGVGDLWMDFPDTDQHYNPRTRQWMLNSGYWSYWYNFDKLINQEIYYQFLMESFYKAYNFLDTSRELIDLTCYQFLTSSVLKEIDFITYLKRFYKK